MKEILEETTYGLNDMVRAAANDCKGCHACCQGMGTSVVLDPLDVCLLTWNLGLNFEELLKEHLELQVSDGLILPNLQMSGPNEACSFLNEQGRCGIHAFRPGLCKTFPLGRQYEDGKLSYFLLPGACAVENRSKVKIGKWLDTPQLRQNQQYLIDWHAFRKQMETKIQSMTEPGQIKQLNMKLLTVFFVRSYDKDRDFYEQFYERLHTI